MKKTILASAIAVASLGMAANAFAAIEEGQLTIWVNGDKGYNGLAEVGKRFEADTGVKVSVAHPDDAPGKFQQAASTGSGPDIFLWAHDRFGDWVDAGLLTEVKPSAEKKAAVEDFAWDAVTINGKIYGYPIAIEAVGLIYNKDLVPNPPKTWEEIPALDTELQKSGKHAILWDYNNTYFTWPLLAANGGYIFKYENGAYDTKDTGVATPGAKMGAKVIKDLIDNGHMPKGADYGVMDSAFNKGEVAMVINGPWAWDNMEKSGINYGVTYIPTINGNKAKPMVGVLAGAINSASPNSDLAIEFLENYLVTDEGLKTVNDDVPLGAVALKSYMEQLSSDPRIAATFANAQDGEPMPNVAAMGKFWSAMATSLTNITSGRQPLDKALDAAARRIAK
ncbi:maltose/maltodextrin ABC transporter substrate-binding protein MalE [Agarivorans gilvus]|jgi:maltose/maltodextrin transport system substrate-binding protein|uniref:Maltodextrin-binding protein n=2 Tax=Agarivorans TaxID=261825 RepID=A0ABQ1I682_9ALTE|nr:maltose/maltodextrin ABC transporter substrate-binding protein MalE [Agarivorans gilvus]GGB16265.1 maltose ABC transporter substrate-binding protein MalE [Agarivorans gilvus]